MTPGSFHFRDVSIKDVFILGFVPPNSAKLFLEAI